MKLSLCTAPALVTRNANEGSLEKRIALKPGALMEHHESYLDLFKETYKQNILGHEVMS